MAGAYDRRVDGVDDDVPLMATYQMATVGDVPWRAALRVAAGTAVAIAFLALAQSAAAADPLAGVPASADTTVAEPAPVGGPVTTEPVEVADHASLAVAEPATLTVEPAVAPPPIVGVGPLGDPLAGVVQPIGQPIVVPVLEAGQVADPITSTLNGVATPPIESGGPPPAPRMGEANGGGPNDDVRAAVLLRPPTAQPAARDPLNNHVASAPSATEASLEHAAPAAGAPKSDETRPPQRSEPPAREAAAMTLRAGSTEQLPVIGALIASVLLLAISTAQLLAPALVAMRGRPVLIPVPPG
jgi:hypothetical protein